MPSQSEAFQIQPSLLAERPDRLERPPHPYHKRQGELKQVGVHDTADTRKLDILATGTGRSTPGQYSTGSSDSEADKDAFVSQKALPAPRPRPRKGLRLLNDGIVTDDSPFLSPSQLHEDYEKLRNGYFEHGGHLGVLSQAQQKDRQDHVKFVRRRKAEVLRRISELISLALLCFTVVGEGGARNIASVHRKEWLCSLSVVSVLLLVYLICLLWPRRSDDGLRFGRIRVPSAFDPAPLLYPPILPVLVSLSFASQWPATFLPNLILGMSSLPAQLMPFTGAYDGYDTCHWILTLMPLMTNDLYVMTLKQHDVRSSIDVEILMVLFPLHQALIPALHFLTTSSLLPAELQLLSISLINVLLHSTTPQALLLGAILWIGGVSIFMLCSKALRRNVALERIPMQDSGHRVRHSNASLTISPRGEPHASRHDSSLSYDAAVDSTKADERRANHVPSAESKRRRQSLSLTLNHSAIRKDLTGDGQITHLRKIQTTPAHHDATTQHESLQNGHNRSQSVNSQNYLSLSHGQIRTRKLLYTTYSYIVIIGVVLALIQFAVPAALSGWEPIGWAVSYLFGDIPGFRTMVEQSGLTHWVPPSPRRNIHLTSPSPGKPYWVDDYRHLLGAGNVRLMLFAYWASVIGMGLFTVLKLLPEFAEVDTRRKVFHGMMVVMLLPTTFVDPCFLSLALILVLTVFLLLELIRAAQLRPLARPLARFITPYVDGRDLRGPIVVSHIFLLIGCAIPLWLSLAAYERQLDPLRSQGTEGKGDPWAGWELMPSRRGSRDVSMVAGVICVGMGDAAASIIGRRFGQRKWPWAGGKSLEGSLAFAIAVTAGIMFAKVWSVAGGWSASNGLQTAWSTILVKAVVAASGASFTEAVLTGANDNVVVPVALWLLVRGLDI